MSPKKQPSNAIRATTYRISMGSSSPMRINPAFIARLQQDDGIIAIHALMKKLEPNIRIEAGVPNNIPKMPLMDREGAVRDIEMFFASNSTAYQNKTDRKNNYRFLTVTSGTGFGKTRLCKEVTGIATRLGVLNVRVKGLFNFFNGCNSSPRSESLFSSILVVVTLPQFQTQLMRI